MLDRINADLRAVPKDILMEKNRAAVKAEPRGRKVEL